LVVESEPRHRSATWRHQRRSHEATRISVLAYKENGSTAPIYPDSTATAHRQGQRDEKVTFPLGDPQLHSRSATPRRASKPNVSTHFIHHRASRPPGTFDLLQIEPS